MSRGLGDVYKRQAEDVTTLEITCVDPVLNLKLILSYSAFEKEDVITRSVKIVNTGKQQVRLEKVYSACLDMDNENFELLTLHGSWGRERHIQRRVICYGKQLVSSAKGKPGHQEHPFIALVTREQTSSREECMECISYTLVTSSDRQN